MLSKKTDDEIMKILDIKSEYRLKRIKEDTKFSPIEMKKILAILHKYEIECRTGNINENYALDCALSEIIAMKR